jgi:hypothetical protein
VVFLADRDAAAGDDEVVLLGRLLEGGAGRVEPVGTMPRSSWTAPSDSIRPRSVNRFEL